MTDDRWCVSCEGRTVGPVPAAVLREWAGDRQIRPGDLVWPAEDPTRAAPASSWPFLLQAANDPELKWYWVRDGRTHGPSGIAYLRLLAATGRLTPDDWVARAGDADWRRAADVGILFPPPVHGPTTEGDRATSPGAEFTQRVSDPSEEGGPTAGPEGTADAPASRRPWRTGLLAAGLSAVFWALPLIGVWVWLGSPPWWVWLALALPAVVSGITIGGRAGQVRPVRETVLANLLFAVGVCLPPAAAVGGGLPWLFTEGVLRTPIGCALAAPGLGAVFGAVVGVVIVVATYRTPRPSLTALSPVDAVVVGVAGVMNPAHGALFFAAAALEDAVSRPRGRVIVAAAAALGAGLTVLFGTFTLLGWGWASLALGAMIGALASAGRAVSVSQDRLKPTPKGALLLAVAVVGLWYVIAIPIAVWAPEVFPVRVRMPAAEPPPATPSVPTAQPFTPAEAERVAAELDRREVGRALFQVTHPSGDFRSATPTVLSPAPDGGRLVGQVEVTWSGTSGAVYRTTYTLTLSRNTADVEVRADTVLFKVKAANRFAAARTLAKLSAEAQAAVRRTGPLPGE